MDDTDLNDLAHMPVPDPSPGARRRAIEAALLAFDAETRKAAGRTKEPAYQHRLISVPTHHLWRWIMEKRVIAGAVAATVLIVPIAGQIVWRDGALLRRLLNSTTETRVAEAPVPVGRASEPENEVPEDATTRHRVDTLASGPARREQAPPLFSAGGSVGGADADMSMHSVTPFAASPTGGMPVARYSPSMPAYREAFDSSALPGQASSVGPAQDVIASVRSPLAAPSPMIEPRLFGRAESRDKFHHVDSNPLKLVTDEPVSTFSIDVDTASYAFVRRALEAGNLPPRDAVRVEEMINYFPYDYPHPENSDVPFRTSIAVYPTPWNPQTKLVHVGIKGYDVVPAKRPHSNLVFLIDVSGSMESPDKLPLLKNAFRLLVDQLGPDDTVAIVTYAGSAGTALEPTRASERSKIFEALGRLEAGGSTAGEEGIRQAYALAERAFAKDGVNRVMLATDGDFNVGISDISQLKDYIETKRKSGIFLSVLGFGQGNYNDALMQALAQNGNGNAAYIDTLSEARKVLIEEAGSTLFPIAKDVKIQVEFNPATVSEYRLIGYETRTLRREDFNNDRVDAGDIGSGHTVTALYEITPKGSSARLVDDLRYRPAEDAAPITVHGSEYAFVKLRYKLPSEDSSRLITVPVTRDLETRGTEALSADMRFAAAVAAFGQKLRGETYLADYGYDAILALARSARGEDRFGYRGEFLSLVQLAGALDRAGRNSATSDQLPR